MSAARLSEEEIQRMIKEAESHAEEDRKRRDLIEARNNADNTVYAAEKALREFGDKVPAEIKSEVDAKVAEVKKAADGDDLESIRSTTQSLGESIQKIGGAVYQQEASAAPAGEPGPEPQPESGPDVVDGEVKE